MSMHCLESTGIELKLKSRKNDSSLEGKNGYVKINQR